MKNSLLTVLAVFAGLLIGGLANSALVALGPLLIPPPAGLDMTTPEGLRSAMLQLEPRHFLFPWLAHAGGTFIGALVAARLAPKHSLLPPLLVGAFFLLGGISMVALVGGPLWFIALDLGFAYLPAALLAARLARSKPGQSRGSQTGN
jgi:hypothetical protein